MNRLNWLKLEKQYLGIQRENRSADDGRRIDYRTIESREKHFFIIILSSALKTILKFKNKLNFSRASNCKFTRKLFNPAKFFLIFSYLSVHISVSTEYFLMKFLWNNLRLHSFKMLQTASLYHTWFLSSDQMKNGANFLGHLIYFN